MKKIFVLIILMMLVTMTSCNSSTREKAMFKYIDSEVEYCIPSDNEHYEVSLILENGEKFIYHSKDDLIENDRERKISMGYDIEEKAYLLAVIKPNK